MTQCMRYDFGVILELRHHMGRHKGTDLDLRHAGGNSFGYPAFLGYSRKDGLHHLQTIAQPDFAQDHIPFHDAPPQEFGSQFAS